MCGDEAAAARSMLQVTYPVSALAESGSEDRGLYGVFSVAEKICLDRWRMVS